MNTYFRESCRAIAQFTLLLLLVVTSQTHGEEPVGKTFSRETLIRITPHREGGITRLFVENVQHADVTVSIEMLLTNLISDVALPDTITLTGQQKRAWFTMTPIDATRGWSWTYTYFSTFGSTTAKHDDHVYSLPYGPGRSYRVSQGNNGHYSHFGADQFATDWRMPLGTPVHAARGGTVVGIKTDSDKGGDDPKYDWDANYVLIKHSDGTLGQYVHLMKGDSFLKVGDRVEEGDLIGLSGNTGHSTGPHLHFAVFKARDGKQRETLPIRFKTADSNAVVLEEGKAYKRPPVSTRGQLVLK